MNIKIMCVVLAALVLLCVGLLFVDTVAKRDEVMREQSHNRIVARRHAEGRRAALAGLPYDANPYAIGMFSGQDEHSDWQAGYVETKLQMEKQ
jgi:hypothetical protein